MFARNKFTALNSSPPGQNGGHFADYIFWCFFLNENVRNWIQFWPQFVLNGPIDNKPALIQVIAWHRTGDNLLPEPMLTQIIDIYASLGGVKSLVLSLSQSRGVCHFRIVIFVHVPETHSVGGLWFQWEISPWWLWNGRLGVSNMQ